jgi:hypothetical protein
MRVITLKCNYKWCHSQSSADAMARDAATHHVKTKYLVCLTVLNGFFQHYQHTEC